APVLTLSSNPICMGNTATLSSNVSGTWMSSNPAVATVDGSGVVTSIAPGNVVFTFTDDAIGCMGTINTSVVDTSPVSGPTSICVGNSFAYTPSTGGTWSSSDPAIATITSG